MNQTDLQTVTGQATHAVMILMLRILVMKSIMLQNAVAQRFLLLQTTFEQLLSRKGSKVAKVRNQITLAKFNCTQPSSECCFASPQTLRQKVIVQRPFHLNFEIRAHHDFIPVNDAPPLQTVIKHGKLSRLQGHRKRYGVVSHI